jgi:hypothetical protein
MRTIQKLELSSSIAALLAGVLQIAFFVFTSEQSEDNSATIITIYGIIYLLFPLMIIGASTYFHAVKQSMIGFGILLVLGSVFVCFFGVLFLFGLLFGGGVKNYVISMLISALPSFFIFFTMLFAIINAGTSSNKDMILQ